MYSILNEIDKYIREHGIPFKDIAINYSTLPSFINHAILEIIRSFKQDRYDFGSEEYTLSYDDNGVLYMMAHDSQNRINVCITNGKLNEKFDYPVTIVSENKIMTYAHLYKYLYRERLNIRKMILTNYKNLPITDRVKLENNIIDNLADTLNGRLKEQNKSVLELTSLESEINKSINLITSYISYLNECYIDSIKTEKTIDTMYGIKYVEPESDTFVRTNTHTYTGSRERYNMIIPVDERIRTLEGYPYIYREFAYSQSSNKIDYMCYMYYLKENTYIIIMEPYSGTKFTKIAIIKEEDMNKDKFIKHVRNYLELSYKEISEAKDIIRSSHTSKEVFDKTINYIIEESTDIHNSYLKKKVKELKEQ